MLVKKSRFIKEQEEQKREASRLLSNLGLKTGLGKIPLLADIPNMMYINVDLLQWFINFCIKSASNTSGGAIKSEIMSKQQLAEE